MKKRRALPVILLAAPIVLAAQSASAQAPPQKLYDKSYALVIGISNYEHADKWPELKNAVKDAQAIAEYLKKSGFEVIPLYDRQAGKDQIDKKLAELSRKKGENDRVLFFFAGHGDTREKNNQDRGYIVPYGGTEDESTFIDVRQLESFSDDLSAKHVLLILDSCYGGALAERGPGSTADTGPKDTDYITRITGPRARQVLTAGGKNQKVGDGSKVEGHSLFTGRLLEALEGGDADDDHNGYLTFEELERYVLKYAVSSRQTPRSNTLPGHKGGRHFVFATAKTTRSLLLIPAEFKLLDPTKPQNLELQMSGPELLRDELRKEARRNVDVALAGATEELRSRGEGAEQRAGYELEIGYRPLERQRIRFEVRFTKTLSTLSDIPAMSVDVESWADFKPLAQKVMQRLSQDAGRHLHLDPWKLKLPPDLEGQVKGAMESWLMNLSVAGIKFAQQEDKETGDIRAMPIAYVTSEGGREVVQLTLVIREAGLGTRQFSERTSAAAWKTSLLALQKKVEAHLSELSK